MMQEENNENEGSCQHCGCAQCTAAGPMRKEFKLAMLEKKEKMLKAKLEFIGKLKDLVNKSDKNKE